MLSKKFLVAGALGLGGLGLIGAGAGATFTQSVASSQQVNAGTMNVTLTGPENSVQSSDLRSVTLAPTQPENSTFDTGPQQLVMHNNGNIPVNAFTLKLTDDSATGSAADQALQGETDVRLISDSYVLYDGTVAALEKLGQLPVAGPIPVNGTDEIEVQFYAGAVPSLVDASNNAVTCAGTLLGGSCPLASSPSLGNEAEGGSFTPTLTLQYEG